MSHIYQRNLDSDRPEHVSSANLQLNNFILSRRFRVHLHGGLERRRFWRDSRQLQLRRDLQQVRLAVVTAADADEHVPALRNHDQRDPSHRHRRATG